MGSSATSASDVLVSMVFFLLCNSALYFALEDYHSQCATFDCGNVKNITYPFFNLTNLLPGCGYSSISCEYETPMIDIIFSGEKRYKVESINYQNQTIIVQDPSLDFRFNSEAYKGCNSLFDVEDHAQSLYLLFNVTSPILTLSKCEGKNESRDKLPFFKNSYSYRRCGDYDLFFNITLPQIQSNPPGCELIHIPVSKELPAFNGTNLEEDDFASLFKGGFHLRWGFPPEEAGTRRDPDKKKKKKLIIGLLPVTGVVAAVFLFFCLWRLSSSDSFIFLEKTESARKVELFLRNFGSCIPKRYKYSQIKKMTNSFKDRLGKGGYGNVYKGKLPDNSLVAVKVLTESKGNGEEFINEVASISKTSHVNIVTLVGFCVEGSKRALIYEFMPNGSLEKFIHEKKDTVKIQPHLGWDILFQIGLGIARGLEYLHRGCNTRIVHFDIKPHNILLDKNFCPKISDFGLAKLCTTTGSIISMMDARGTIGYIAPEVFCKSFGGVTHKSDVYSYGMMVLEMVGGRKNIDAGADNTSEIYFPHWIYNRLELNENLELLGVMNKEEENIARKMILVGLWCIQTNQSNRPSMNEVLDMLQGSIESLQIPPKPYLSSPPRSQASSSTVRGSFIIPHLQVEEDSHGSNIHY